MTLQIAALASGAGSNVRSIIAAIAEAKLDARMRLVLSNNPGAGALRAASEAGVPIWSRSHKDYADREAFDRALLEAVKESGADVVVLAGYMRLLSPFFVKAFQGRILNVHPAVLPSFPGVHGARDAIAYGVRFTGPTVHFVDEEMDSGPVIIQAVTPLAYGEDEETVMRRMHALEHRIYPQALQWLAEGRLRIEGRKVELLPPPDGGRLKPATQGEGELGPWLVCPALEAF